MTLPQLIANWPVDAKESYDRKVSNLVRRMTVDKAKAQAEYFTREEYKNKCNSTQ